jgi:hypothetical protein
MVSTEAERSNRKIHRVIEGVGGSMTRIGPTFRLIFPVYRWSLTSYSWQAFLKKLDATFADFIDNLV